MQNKEMKKVAEAMKKIEDDRKVDQSLLIEALKEAIEKAYRKQSNLSDVNVRVDIDSKMGIRAFHLYNVVAEVEDFELEISIEDAKEINNDFLVGDVYEKEINIKEFTRAAAVAAKNVVRQKIREAEKKVIYDEYIDLLEEMVLGVVETVEEKHVIVNLGKTFAVMTKSAQMPNEKYVEGQKIRVVITECNKEFKGAQVKVSRADPLLVRRLFEKEIPEVYQGLIEIKAIAREAGERTKVAVFSKNSDIDARGSCIGQRGSRVQSIMQELQGEKIEIFEWNDDLGQMIDNTFSPAEVKAVYYGEDQKRIVVVVNDNQLSIAIGRKGSNAKLASKLLNLKIDIKPLSEMIEAGIDLETKKAEFKEILEQKRQEKIRKEQEEKQEQIRIAQEKKDNLINQIIDEEDEINDEFQSNEVYEIDAVEQINLEKQKEEQERLEAEIKLKQAEEKAKEEARIAKEKEEEEMLKIIKKRRELKPKVEYVSKLENLAENKSTTANPEKTFKKRKNKDDEERRIRAKDLLKDREYDIKPMYSEEELEEIENTSDEELAKSWIEDEIDFDEYDEYYDHED